MKKPILLLIFFTTLIFNSNTAFGQDEDSILNEKYSEFGINVTSFVNEFISLNNNNSDVGKYMVTYKYHFGKKAFRLGLGGRFSQMDDETEGGGNRSTKHNVFDIRVGYEIKNKISSRWAYYVGIDGVFGWNEFTSTTFNFDQVEIKNTLTSFGGGPIMGIQFFINPKISLATEGGLFFVTDTSREMEKFSINPNFNKDESSSSSRLNFGLPTSLFFIIRF